MAKTTPEGKVKKNIDKILKKHGVWFFKPMTYGRGRSGIPDYICCVFGAFFSIEAKAGNNEPTAAQDKEGQLIQKSGGWWIVVNEQRIDDLDNLIQMIIDLGQKNKAAARERYNETIDELDTKAEQKSVARSAEEASAIGEVGEEVKDA